MSIVKSNGTTYEYRQVAAWKEILNFLKIICQIKKKSKTQFDEVPMELSLHGKGWQISYWFFFLAPQQSTLWAEGKPKA